MRDASNPCLTCGACCAAFRVSFYWSEADPSTGGAVPMDLTEPISPTLLAMRGTNRHQPRCIALEGEVGKRVRCGIYAQRSSTCQECTAGSSTCNKARRAHGLPELPVDTQGVGEQPVAQAGIPDHGPGLDDKGDITSQVIATFTS